MAQLPRDITREDILAALDRYDREIRPTREGQRWEQNAAHRWAIAHEGRFYPVKQIIALATGEELRSFSGGPEANRYVTQRGFAVVRRDEADSTNEPAFMQTSRDLIQVAQVLHQVGDHVHYRQALRALATQVQAAFQHAETHCWRCDALLPESEQGDGGVCPACGAQVVPF